MMKERLVSLKEAADLLPKRKGKPFCTATLRRWANVGACGYRLETVKVGRVIYTSLEALERFLDRLNSPETQEAATQESR